MDANDFNRILETLNRGRMEAQYIEDKYISHFLSFFNIPEKSTQNIRGIDEMLTWETINIFLPKSLYEAMEWNNIEKPKKIIFHKNPIEDSFYVCDNISLSKIPSIDYNHSIEFGNGKGNEGTKDLLDILINNSTFNVTKLS